MKPLCDHVSNVVFVSRVFSYRLQQAYDCGPEGLASQGIVPLDLRVVGYSPFTILFDIEPSREFTYRVVLATEDKYSEALWGISEECPVVRLNADAQLSELHEAIITAQGKKGLSHTTHPLSLPGCGFGAARAYAYVLFDFCAPLNRPTPLGESAIFGGDVSFDAVTNRERQLLLEYAALKKMDAALDLGNVLRSYSDTDQVFDLSTLDRGFLDTFTFAYVPMTLSIPSSISAKTV